MGLAGVLAAHQAGQLLARAELRSWPAAAGYAGLLGVAAWLPAARRAPALWGLAALSGWQCFATFPRTANHAFLAALAAALVALRADDRDDAHWSRQFLALGAIAFFWAGVQKLVHGHWFDGQALGWLIATREDVAAQLRPLVDDATAAGLGALSPTRDGAGPFQLPGGWRVASNGVWILEVLSPAALLLRSHAWWLLLAAAWGAQWVAHEWEFALLLSVLALGGAPARARSIGLAAVLAGIACLALARLGVVPVPPALLPTVNL